MDTTSSLSPGLIDPVIACPSEKDGKKNKERKKEEEKRSRSPRQEFFETC